MSSDNYAPAKLFEQRTRLTQKPSSSWGWSGLNNKQNKNSVAQPQQGEVSVPSDGAIGSKSGSKKLAASADAKYNKSFDCEDGDGPCHHPSHANTPGSKGYVEDCHDHSHKAPAKIAESKVYDNDYHDLSHEKTPASNDQQPYGDDCHDRSHQLAEAKQLSSNRKDSVPRSRSPPTEHSCPFHPDGGLRKQTDERRISDSCPFADEHSAHRTEYHEGGLFDDERRPGSPPPNDASVNRGLRVPPSSNHQEGNQSTSEERDIQLSESHNRVRSPSPKSGTAKQQEKSCNIDTDSPTAGNTTRQFSSPQKDIIHEPCEYNLSAEAVSTHFSAGQHEACVPSNLGGALHGVLLSPNTGANTLTTESGHSKHREITATQSKNAEQSKRSPLQIWKKNKPKVKSPEIRVIRATEDQDEFITPLMPSQDRDSTSANERKVGGSYMRTAKSLPGMRSPGNTERVSQIDDQALVPTGLGDVSNVEAKKTLRRRVSMPNLRKKGKESRKKVMSRTACKVLLGKDLGNHTKDLMDATEAANARGTAEGDLSIKPHSVLVQDRSHPRVGKRARNLTSPILKLLLGKELGERTKLIIDTAETIDNPSKTVNKKKKDLTGRKDEILKNQKDLGKVRKGLDKQENREVDASTTPLKSAMKKPQNQPDFEAL